MAFVVIIGLVVAVLALLTVNSQLRKENQALQEPKPKVRRKKNATKL